MKKHLRPLSWIALGLWTACAGMRPNPKYTERDSIRPQLRSTDASFQTRLAEQIEAYLGVPYRWGGRSRDGMDCSGFVTVVYENALGLTLPHRARTMYDLGRLVEPSELQYGDLVFFEKIENYGVSHVGIYVGDGQFAHASTTRGVILSRLNEPYYRERFVGARRVVRR